MKSSISFDPEIPTANWIVLTRHFFRGFFRLGFLDDAGEESFKRALIGVLAAILAIGLFAARVYFNKYYRLASAPTADAYRWALGADQLFMITVPMWAVALTTALIAHSVFPDETDFRVLMALPVRRHTVFAAKLAALLLFAAILIGTASLGFGVPFSLVTGGQWAEQPFAMRATAQLAAGMLGSICTFAVIVGIQGLIVVLTPPRRLMQASVAAQTLLVCGLVLLLPVVGRMPAWAVYLNQFPAALRLLPPGWFFGLEQYVLGNRDWYFTTLAGLALLATFTALIIAAGCYLVVYRRFDGQVLRPAAGRRAPWWNTRLPFPRRRHPAQDAIHGLISATLHRSGLHQLAVFAMFAAAVALAVNNLLGAGSSASRWLIIAVMQTPLILIVAAVLGLRTALLLPAHLRAGWIFRITETRANRSQQLNAVHQTLLLLGVVGPELLAVPLQLSILGPLRTLAGLPIILMLGWVFVEAVVNQWRRIPFTCTVLFAKRPTAYTFLMVGLAFGGFGTIGTVLLQIASAGRPVSWSIVAAVTLAIGLALRRSRLQYWGEQSLEFEDAFPDALDTLRLN